MNDVILDIGTGAGSVAFHAASIVGPGGKVFGIDISKSMIPKANALLKASSYSNIDLLLADAENLPLSKNCFDYSYCASAFFWMANKENTLKHWFDLLNPAGTICFHA